MGRDEKEEIRVEDRRHFDREGNPIQEGEQPDQAPPAQQTEVPKPPSGPPPKINFFSLLFIYTQTALVHLGELEEPSTAQKTANLPAAQQIIDILELLQEKTRGNLTTQESQYLEDLLFDLRMRYVEKTKTAR